MSTTLTKNYETIPAGEVYVGDVLRQQVWDAETQSGVWRGCRVIEINDGASSRWITFDGGQRIRPRRTTKVQRMTAGEAS